MERFGSITLANSAPLASASAGMSANTAPAWSLQTIVSVARSQTKAAWPRQARMVEVCGSTAVKFASFRDRGGDSPDLRIEPVRSKSLNEVHKHSGNHDSQSR